MNIRIQYDTNPSIIKLPNVLLWDTYEEIISADINKGKGGSYNVYIKNQMPRREMDNIILELCERIAWNGHSPISYGSIDRRYVFSGESNCDEIITKASYQFIV